MRWRWPCSKRSSRGSSGADESTRGGRQKERISANIESFGPSGNFGSMSRNKVYLKFALFLSVILAASVTIYIKGWHRLFLNRNELIAFVESFNNVWGVLVFAGIQTAQVMLAPVPGEITGFVGGYLFGPCLGLVYSTLGLTVGSVGAFLLARKFGRPLVEKVASQEFLNRYDFLIDHRGKWISFFLFLIPGFPKDLFCYLLGTSHMTFGTFFIISTVGRFLGTALLSVSGSLARNESYQMFIVVAVIAGIAAFLSYVYRERWITWLRHHRHHGHDLHK